MHVFTYGTLMLPAVFERVTGTRLAAQPAQLRDHARYALRGQSYPGLVPEAGAATNGILWLDVDSDTATRLDTFEGDWYQRCTVTVHSGDGDARPADAYLLRPQQQHRIVRRRWSLARFEARHLQRFLSDYEGFHR